MYSNLGNVVSDKINLSPEGQTWFPESSCRVHNNNISHGIYSSRKMSQHCYNYLVSRTIETNNIAKHKKKIFYIHQEVNVMCFYLSMALMWTTYTWYNIWNDISHFLVHQEKIMFLIVRCYTNLTFFIQPILKTTNT